MADNWSNIGYIALGVAIGAIVGALWARLVTGDINNLQPVIIGVIVGGVVGLVYAFCPSSDERRQKILLPDNPEGKTYYPKLQ